MDKKRFEQLFWKYTAGELSPSEKGEFFHQLEQPEYALFMEELTRKVWDEIPKESAINFSGKRRVERIVAQVKQRGSQRSYRWIQVAAAVLLLLGGTLFYNRKAWHDFGEKKQQLVWHELQAPYGHKKQISMPDGTVIYLNAGSSLRYSDHFNKTDRQIYLKGEAFFDVAIRADLPFVVKGNQLDIRVLGTSFNVYAFEQDSTYTVDVLTGKIGIQDTILQAGQRLVYSKKSGAIQLAKIANPEMISTWKTGQLVLNGQGFDEAAAILERWYDVRIHYNPTTVQHCRFVGKFNQLPIEQVLRMLKQTSSFTYRIVDKDIFINE